jgi:hypothetical protein
MCHVPKMPIKLSGTCVHEDGKKNPDNHYWHHSVLLLKMQVGATARAASSLSESISSNTLTVANLWTSRLQALMTMSFDRIQCAKGKS